ncbi:hypothetical protein BCR44DRAFT_1428322 [Catenaria anguillulae PL171]|uniref:J domain-containing protein n=1 Tax=Catenaria anguillulae PL171 TaxID=765915 RepID=A0A1Y2HV32_9FUNG|nr:hypothetical protein BCR44DRAFT_1428322 [Catenaria anguillulae PL171]
MNNTSLKTLCKTSSTTTALRLTSHKSITIMTILTLHITLPPAPSSASASAPAPSNDAPLAALFGAAAVDHAAANGDDADDQDALDPEHEAYLESLDPKDWKRQDHYRLLGLSHLRYKATQDEIKAAHRKAVLRHHPDKLTAKLAAQGKSTDQADSIFKCLAKAFDTLADETKRRAYDSVDRGVSDATPTDAQLRMWFADSPQAFYAEVQAVFDREARFALKPNRVPKFGDDASSKGAVEKFYAFWTNWESWRSFEYFDEDTESASNRDHKRHLEAKNKSQRTKLKTEDNARVRMLVERVMAVDPRMRRFKEEEKAAKKNKGKPMPAASLRPGSAAAAAAAPAATTAKPVPSPSDAKIAEAQAVLAKEAEKDRKAALKAHKKAIKAAVTKQHSYLTSDATPSAKHMEAVLIDLERLIEGCKDDLMELGDVRSQLESALSPDAAAKVVEEVLGRHAHEAKDAQQKIKNQAARASAAMAAKTGSAPWSAQELGVLVQAVNKIPGGTTQRWDKIAEYVSHHAGTPLRKTVDVIAQSKEIMSKPGAAGAALAALKSLQDKERKEVVIKDAPTQRDMYEFQA